MMREIIDWLKWLWEDFTSPKRNEMPYLEEELAAWKSIGFVGNTNRHTMARSNQSIPAAFSTRGIVRPYTKMSVAIAHARVLSRMTKHPGFPKFTPQMALVA